MNTAVPIVYDAAEANAIDDTKVGATKLRLRKEQRAEKYLNGGRRGAFSLRQFQPRANPKPRPAREGALCAMIDSSRATSVRIWDPST